MRGKTSLVVLAALLCVLLSGCFPWSAEDSYKLPRPPKDYENLMQAVAQTKRELALEYSATVEDVPPSAGDNTSTVQLLDMDGDGEQETAVTFFRILGADMPVRLYFYTLQEDGRYVLSNVIQGEGDSVYAVYYADLDGARDPLTQKHCKEVVVSWRMGSGADYLGVYALEAEQMQAQTLIMTAYQTYRLVDLDRDGLTELAVARINQELTSGEVALHDWNAAGVATVSSAALSAGISAIGQMKADYLTDLIPALYITGELAAGGKVTDVLAVCNGELTNLTVDPETGVSRELVTGLREMAPADVNSDYISEIARPRQLPAYGTAVNTWLMDWVQYDARGRAKEICTTYHNTADGWYLIIPDHWRNRLTIYRNDSVSGQRAVVFALWQGAEKEPLPFLSIYKLTGASRSTRADSGNRFILAEDSSAVYAATFYNTWNCGLDENGLLENFRLIVSSWSGD
ncbi:MAG: hypothetical protein E7440_02155 [Ruminococcaceae bacterium]|nr:hypothetical protein [Oscillospiraceae bacterium]